MQDFNTDLDFKDHEKDHPSVERIPLVQKHQNPFSMKKDFKCTHCSKKFKNETSLNYHSMFHTSEESTPPPPPSTSTSTQPQTKKLDPSPKPLVKSSQTHARSVSYDSSDSDSDNDSKFLSLKHISNSVKRMSEGQHKLPVKKKVDSNWDLDTKKVPKSKEASNSNVKKTSESQKIPASTKKNDGLASNPKSSQKFKEKCE